MIGLAAFDFKSAITFVDKHPIREFSALACDNGISLCAKDRGSFLVIRYKEDLESIKDLLNKIEITTSFSDVKDEVR